MDPLFAFARYDSCRHRDVAPPGINDPHYVGDVLTTRSTCAAVPQSLERRVHEIQPPYVGCYYPARCGKPLRPDDAVTATARRALRNGGAGSVLVVCAGLWWSGRPGSASGRLSLPRTARLESGHEEFESCSRGAPLSHVVP